MNYILIKFDDKHCTILEDSKGVQVICHTKVDAIRIQAKNKEYTIVPMTDVISLIDNIRLYSKARYDYYAGKDPYKLIEELIGIFREI